MNLRTFGEWLRHRRLKLDISPFKISEELGYKRVSAIYNFEYGVAPIPMAKWPAMARVLELPLEEFLTVMDRFSPQKVSEFRAIQAAAVSVEEGHSGTVQLVDRNVDESNGKGLQTFRLEGAQIAVVLQGNCSVGFMNYINELWKSGRKVGVVQIRFPQPFPGVAVVEQLKKVSTIGVFEWEMGQAVATMVKAAFLDALTGSSGFPHIHRVPKIYTCLMEQASQFVEAEHLRGLLDLFDQGVNTRLVRIATQPQISV